MSRPADTPRWRACFEAAQAELAAGRSRAAAPLLETALKLKPDLAEGWGLLTQIRTAAGDLTGARAAELATFAAPFASLRAAADALATGRPTDAESELRARAPRTHGEAVAARLLAAECALRSGRPTDALILLEPLAGDADAKRIRARIHLAARRLADALAELDDVLAASPGDLAALAIKAALLTDLRRHDEAAAANAAVVRAFPDQPYARLALARGLRALGRTEEAIGEWRTCLRIDPACGEAWLSLSDLKTYRFSEGETSALRAMADAAPQDSRLGFALGAALEQAGFEAGAFAAWTSANALEAARRRYDPDATSAFVARSRDALTADFFGRRKGWGARDAAPVFVVGLPRSGSTLVEQILASHPAIEGADELPDLPFLAARAPGYPEGLVGLTPADCAALGAEYLRRARQTLRLGRPGFVDKTPKNFLHAGFIRLTLPKAKIVDVRRHPLDCGVSIFRQHFGLGFSSAFDLGHIGRYWRDYAALMAHWDEAAPGLVHRVIYERLVVEPESEIRRLLDFLELPFDTACLAFFDNPRAVDTPSSEQVRRPIFTDAVGRWRRYDPWLGPLRAELGGWDVSYPDPPAP